MKEKIVVCMPVKNAEKTLRDSIISVILQKGAKRDIVLLIGNDGSTDSSRDVINEFLPNPNIIIVDLAFANAAKTRNHLNEHARSNISDVVLIGRLDADDVLLDEHTIAKIEAMFDCYNFDVFMSGNKQSKNGELLEWTNRPSKQLLNHSYLLNQLKEMMQGNARAELPSCNTFIKPTVNIEYPDKQSAEDHWFTVLLLLNNHKYNIYIDEDLIYCIYSLDGQTTANNRRSTTYNSERKALYDFATEFIQNKLMVKAEERWSKFINNEGTSFHYQNALDNKERLSNFWKTDCPLHSKTAELVVKLGKSTLQLLDAGCGPFPKSGLYLNGFHIERTLIDALGNQYHQMLSDLNIDTNGQHIISCEIEKAVECFSNNSFDIVFAKNCIDHTYNPFAAIKSLFALTQKGGFIYLEHYKNEGEYTGYSGLHQWNITLQNGDLTIFDKDKINRANISELIAPNSLEVYEHDSKIYAVIKKDV